jgi:hypothetical protein
MGTEYRAGFLRAESCSSEDVRDFWSGNYDVLVIASSWDSRCMALSQCGGLRASLAVLLLYDAMDDQGLREAHDEGLKSYLACVAETVEEVRGQATNVYLTWRTIMETVIGAARAKGRPLNVACDITTIPRYVSCGLLAAGFRLGIVRQFEALYSEGTYPSASPGEVVFKSGRWETLNVPFLGGEAEAGNETLLVVSLGFEGAQTYRSVARLDPDQLAVLIPDPGVRPSYPARTLRQNRQLLSDYNVERSARLRAHAGDAIAAWQALSVAAAKCETRTSTLYLPTGTKPHALGMALHCLETSGPTLLYNRPRQHRIVSIEPTGTHWSYQIVDLSMPPSSGSG